LLIATFKDLCLDAADPSALGPFWSKVLGREWHAQDGGDGHLTGPTPADTIWVNRVPEPRTAKNRVHLDIYARSLPELEALGARVVLPEGDDRHWTVMADVDGGEFCAFLREEVPAQRLHGLVVDSVDPVAIATWWHETLGGDLERYDGTWATISGIPGFPIETFDFVPSPDTRTVKNRVHWDVTAHPHDLVARGARLLRARDDEIGWDVLADPEGNEFCVFAPA
jgi:hypothetical protein